MSSISTPADVELKVDRKINYYSVSMVETTEDQTDDKILHSSRLNRSTDTAQLMWRGKTTWDQRLTCARITWSEPMRSRTEVDGATCVEQTLMLVVGRWCCRPVDHEVLHHVNSVQSMFSCWRFNQSKNRTVTARALTLRAHHGWHHSDLNSNFHVERMVSDQ